MIALVESHQSWLETITYQMCNMSYDQQAQNLGGPIALMKMSITRAAHEIADEAVQIWGGRGLTSRPVWAASSRTSTGLTSLMPFWVALRRFGDLGVRQAMKNMPKSVL